jgi:hypothetical protein
MPSAMANSSGPGAPFEETERVKLIEIITEKLGNLTDYTHKISTFKTSYAALWLADIEKLKALSDKEPFDIYASLLVFESDHRIGQRCQQSSSLYHYVRLTVCSIQGKKRTDRRKLLTRAKDQGNTWTRPKGRGLEDNLQTLQ